ncbi:MAG: thioredoxin domain-containing protein, partial [Patescibacteria group bacterium]
MREYFWHIIVTLGLFVVLIFGATVLSLQFSNDINFTDSEAISTPAITIVDPQLGDADAPVTVVTYSDYACASCATIESILVSFLQEHPGSIRIVWKD